MSRIAEKALSVHENLVAGAKDQIEAAHELARRGIPLIMGAEAVPSHPLGPPTVSGPNLTVDLALQNPTRITRMIEDLTLQRFLLDRVFGNGGSVNGGAVIYEEAVLNELYGNATGTGPATGPVRDVESIAPGSEYPIFEAQRSVPKIAPVEKWGGKVFITDEARDRNEAALFQRKIRQLSNTIVRRLNLRAVEILDAAVSEHSRTGSSVDWSAVVTAGSSASSAEEWPIKTFADAMMQVEEDELGLDLDLVILNPQEYGQLITIYGGISNLRDLIGGLGFTIYVTNRQDAGKAKFVSSGNVGQYRVEQPLRTVTYRSGDGEDTDRTWVKSSVRPVMFVDNPFAVWEATGLAG